MKDIGIKLFYGAFAVLMLSVAWQMRQDLVTSNYCQSIGLGWHRSEGFFTRYPKAICMETSIHKLSSEISNGSE